MAVSAGSTSSPPGAPACLAAPVAPADPRRAPRTALIPRAHEHQEQPDGVGAVARHELIRILDVAARLAHPLAIRTQDLALVEQPEERLILVDQADVAHGLGEEPAVQEVHDGVLGAARVLVHRGPAIHEGTIDCAAGLLRGEVAETVP